MEKEENFTKQSLCGKENKQNSCTTKKRLNQDGDGAENSTQSGRNGKRKYQNQIRMIDSTWYVRLIKINVFYFILRSYV